MKIQGILFGLFMVTRMWCLEKLIRLTPMFSFHNNARPLPLPSLSTPMQPAKSPLLLIPSCFLLKSFVSKRKTASRTFRLYKSCRTQIPCGFPSPQEFQLRIFIRYGRVAHRRSSLQGVILTESYAWRYIVRNQFAWSLYFLLLFGLDCF